MKMVPKKNYDNNGNLVSEYTLLNGKLNGIGKRYFPNGKLNVISTFVNGRKEGNSKEYDEDGVLTGVYNYKNDTLNGPYKIYENGKLKLVGNFENGAKTGHFKTYDENGDLIKEYDIKDDLLNGKYVENRYSDHKLIIQYTSLNKNDKENGYSKLVKFIGDKPYLLEYHSSIDGKYDGKFKEVSHDSIIYGSYVNGQLDGEYKVYTTNMALFTGEKNGDTTNSILLTSGIYANGLKSGHWKFYSITRVLIGEGDYSFDNKSGEWRYYYDSYVTGNKNNPDEHTEYSRQLYLIENYENGKLNGKCTRYSHLEKVEIPCDEELYKNKTNKDTCYEDKYVKELKISTYKNDELNGLYEYRDSLGLLVYKGDYKNGRQDGDWLEGSTEMQIGEYRIPLSNFYLFQKGNYINGEKNGVWQEYSDDNNIDATYNYKNGKLDGKSIFFNTKIKKPSRYIYYENGDFKSIEMFDSLGMKIISSYILVGETEKDVSFSKKEYRNDSVISQVYFIDKGKDKKILYEFLDQYFLNKNDKKSSDSYAYPFGKYQVYDMQQRLVIDGEYNGTQKTGKWTTYFDDIGIIRNQEFSNGLCVSEKFITLDLKPFSGKLNLNYPNGKVQAEIKIRDGVRDGKSKYFDENGNEVKTEKYNKGVLKD